MEKSTVLVRGDGTVRAPWRIAFFLAASIVAGMAMATVVYPLLSLTPLVALARESRLPLDQLGTVAALLMGTWAALHVMDGKREHRWPSVGLNRTALRWRAIMVGLVAGTLAILVPSLLLLAAGSFRLAPQAAGTGWLDASRIALLVLAPSAFAEELAMRGYVFTVLRESVRVPGAIAVTSIAFALLHVFNPDPSVLSIAVVALAGVFLSIVRVVTNSLYAVVIAHLGWNFVQAAVLHAPVSGLTLPTPGYRLVDAGPAWLTGGAWGPEGGLAAAAGMLVATFLVSRLGSTRTFWPGSGRPDSWPNTRGDGSHD